MYWPITIKFRIRKQTSKPQTNYRCCLQFSYLAPYWLISRNTITFHKYFWCSRLCEFHSNTVLYFALFFSLFLAFPLANWSVSFDNATATSIRFSWQNLQSLVGQQLSHYFIVVKASYGSRLNEYIVSGNTTSHVLSGLSAWREYRLSIVGVNYRGNAYNSTEITAWTDEGGTCIIYIKNKLFLTPLIL